MGGGILTSILGHYRFPEKTFVGSPEAIQSLKEALGRKRRVERP